VRAFVAVVASVGAFTIKVSAVITVGASHGVAAHLVDLLKDFT
jgi:hypothetical protein